MFGPCPMRPMKRWRGLTTQGQIGQSARDMQWRAWNLHRDACDFHLRRTGRKERLGVSGHGTCPCIWTPSHSNEQNGGRTVGPKMNHLTRWLSQALTSSTTYFLALDLETPRQTGWGTSLRAVHSLACRREAESCERKERRRKSRRKDCEEQENTSRLSVRIRLPRFRS